MFIFLYIFFCKSIYSFNDHSFDWEDSRTRLLKPRNLKGFFEGSHQHKSFFFFDKSWIDQSSISKTSRSILLFVFSFFDHRDAVASQKMPKNNADGGHTIYTWWIKLKLDKHNEKNKKYTHIRSSIYTKSIHKYQKSSWWSSDWCLSLSFVGIFSLLYTQNSLYLLYFYLFIKWGLVHICIWGWMYIQCGLAFAHLTGNSPSRNHVTT